MPEQEPISLFVKLGHWDVYRLNVVFTATAFRKILYIWGFVALLFLSVFVLLLIRPSSAHDWAVMQQNARPLTWAFTLPVIFVFVLPLLSAQRVLRDELVKRGVNYQFSEAGVHIETSISKTDLSWAAIRRVREFPSEISGIHQSTHCAHASQKVFREQSGRGYLTKVSHLCRNVEPSARLNAMP